MLSMWRFHFSLFWIVTPSSLSASTWGMAVSLTETSTACGPCEAVTSMEEHFEALIIMWSVCAEAETLSMTICVLLRPSLPFPSGVTANVMSSTNFHLSEWWAATSLTITRNTTGSSLVPCGTPQVTVRRSEMVPLTRTRCLRLVRKALTQGSSFRRTPACAN